MFVGSMSLQVDDPTKGLSFPVTVFCPTESPSAPVTVGPYQIDLAVGAPVGPGRYPVVGLSHGGGSTPLVYRTLAHHLALNGFVVAMPEHPGDNRSDRSASDSAENLARRPRHLRLALEAVTRHAALRVALRADSIALVGHSMGGYTALALAGGQPYLGIGQKVEVTHEPRVKALVLMAPATSAFVVSDSLRGVHAPVLLYMGLRDVVTPRWQAQLVLDHLPDPTCVTLREVEDAGHYSFLSPFPPSMAGPNFPPSVDWPGFDRVAFHARMNKEIVTFLRSNLD